MKHRVAIVLFTSFLFLASAQRNSASERAVSPSFGLGTGEKAPAFAARDQFDREQSNETLRGSNGTILLFFRSADW